MELYQSVPEANLIDKVRVNTANVLAPTHVRARVEPKNVQEIPVPLVIVGAIVKPVVKVGSHISFDNIMRYGPTSVSTYWACQDIHRHFRVHSSKRTFSNLFHESFKIAPNSPYFQKIQLDLNQVFADINHKSVKFRVAQEQPKKAADYECFYVVPRADLRRDASLQAGNVVDAVKIFKDFFNFNNSMPIYSRSLLLNDLKEEHYKAIEQFGKLKIDDIPLDSNTVVTLENFIQAANEVKTRYEKLESIITEINAQVAPLIQSAVQANKTHDPHFFINYINSNPRDVNVLQAKEAYKTLFNGLDKHKRVLTVVGVQSQGGGGTVPTHPDVFLNVVGPAMLHFALIAFTFHTFVPGAWWEKLIKIGVNAGIFKFSGFKETIPEKLNPVVKFCRKHPKFTQGITIIGAGLTVVALAPFLTQGFVVGKYTAQIGKLILSYMNVNTLAQNAPALQTSASRALKAGFDNIYKALVEFTTRAG